MSNHPSQRILKDEHGNILLANAHGYILPFSLGEVRSSGAIDYINKYKRLALSHIIEWPRGANMYFYYTTGYKVDLVSIDDIGLEEYVAYHFMKFNEKRFSEMFKNVNYNQRAFSQIVRIISRLP